MLWYCNASEICTQVLKRDEEPMTLHSSSLSGNRGLIKSPLAMHFDFDCRECSQQLLNSPRLVDWCMTALSKKPCLFCFTGKVAGVRWEGSKTVFDDDTKDASHDPQPTPGAITEAMANSPQAVSQSQPAPIHDSQDDVPKIKWKKMASTELHKVGQTCNALQCEQHTWW